MMMPCQGGMVDDAFSDRSAGIRKVMVVTVYKMPVELILKEMHKFA